MYIPERRYLRVKMGSMRHGAFHATAIVEKEGLEFLRFNIHPIIATNTSSALSNDHTEMRPTLASCFQIYADPAFLCGINMRQGRKIYSQE